MTEFLNTGEKNINIFINVFRKMLLCAFLIFINVLVVKAEDLDDPYLDVSVNLQNITNPAERAAAKYHPISNPLHAAGMLEAQEAARNNGVFSSFMTCPDGFLRYFNENGEMLRDQLIPDRSAYVDIDGIKLDPKDNNINRTFMKYASHGRRALAYDKSSHYMELWFNGNMVKSYMVTSGAAEGDKEKQGDYRTPVGYFYICEKKVSDSLKEEMGLNYPNIEDARRGLKSGLISSTIADQLISASRNLQKPLWNTALGGAIEVHGQGELMDATRGCIGVYNEWVKEIYDVMEVGDRVYIVE
ncbi:L,D-transpeptidase family protein [Oribacterium sp. WCC10]|uniref:L,D-transpeptidase family protein n=1 Tax=Oribacterium sp. WCC10 TaxID=1855343 RepID=UPI0008E87EA7|nr:L,D-transpeptidase [Oribacterium sp. WCC10]SFG68613.1 L,D-transpeptidase catalytic domain [Oribacterium sp. WCC10]